MKEYKVVEVEKNEVEKTMNDMAKDGWEVVSTNYWNAWKVSIMITFVREK